MTQPQITHCQRCGARCRVAGPRNEKATLLRRSKTAAGYCATCAVHDWLRNTYPVNIQLAEAGPKILVYPHVRKLFADIMRSGAADMKPDEINWNLLVENWDLPWPHRMKPTRRNPCTEQQLDEIKSGKKKAFGNWPHPPDPLPGVHTITSFDQLNQIEPGAGDSLRDALHKTFGPPKEEEATEADHGDDEPPATQKELF